MKIRTTLKLSRKTHKKYIQMTDETVKSNLPLTVIKVFVNKLLPPPCLPDDNAAYLYVLKTQGQTS